MGKTKTGLLKARKNRQQGLDDDDSEITDVTQIPDIKRLEVEIDCRPKKGIKIEDIVGTADPNDEIEKPVNPKGQQEASHEDVLKEFQREAGAIKPKS